MTQSKVSIEQEKWKVELFNKRKDGLKEEEEAFVRLNQVSPVLLSLVSPSFVRFGWSTQQVNYEQIGGVSECLGCILTSCVEGREKDESLSVSFPSFAPSSRTNICKGYG